MFKRTQLLSSHIFGFLNAEGIHAEIIIGEVRVHGTLEFDANLDQLLEDFKLPDMSKGQMLHAWVSIGGDTIIDAGLSHRMVKYYGLPDRLAAPILIGRASDLSKKYYVRHQPIIVGAEYLARTTKPDPSTFINFYKLNR